MKKIFGVYAYLRVSGKGQIGGHGFERQLNTITDYCKKNKYQIIEVFEEQVSGVKDEGDRPVFKSMISNIGETGVFTIVVEGMDRLARQLMVQEQLLVYLCVKGITLISASTGEDVTAAVQDDPMKKAMIQMQGVFSELDKSRIVKRLSDARFRIRQRGEKCEGAKSYEETFPEVLWVIDKLRLKKRNKVQKTYNQIAAILNEQGHRNIKGELFTANAVNNILFRSKRRDGGRDNIHKYGKKQVRHVL